jgi:hypothetical protein
MHTRSWHGALRSLIASVVHAALALACLSIGSDAYWAYVLTRGDPNGFDLSFLEYL